MLKKAAIALAVIAVLLGPLALVHKLQSRTLEQITYSMQPTKVTGAKVTEVDFSPTISTVGTVVAAQGVTVSTEVGGTVRRIAFESGAAVKQGDLLVELDFTTEEAQLHSAEASAELARISLVRSRELRATNTISQADLDSAEAQAKQADAQVANIKAVIAKKTIRAPFSGRLGIREINLGQYLNPGAPIVSLQSVDPVYVDASVPQQELSRIAEGMAARVTSDAYAGANFDGKVTAINTEVDPATRNVRVRSTLANADGRLRPGMFVNMTLVEPSVKKAITIPGTAVLYAPYGDSVFVIETKKNDQTGETMSVLKQQFIRIGSTRGDFVTIVDGLKIGESVVSSGVFKLRTGMPVVVDNTLAPDAKLNPTPDNT